MYCTATALHSDSNCPPPAPSPQPSCAQSKRPRLVRLARYQPCLMLLRARWRPLAVCGGLSPCAPPGLLAPLRGYPSRKRCSATASTAACTGLETHARRRERSKRVRERAGSNCHLNSLPVHPVQPACQSSHPRIPRPCPAPRPRCPPPRPPSPSEPPATHVTTGRERERDGECVWRTGWPTDSLALQ